MQNITFVVSNFSAVWKTFSKSNIKSAVTLEKLCYIKAQLNKAPCFNKSRFGEPQREHLIYLSQICRNKSRKFYLFRIC